MATPLLLSDVDLISVKTTFAGYFTDPEPFRKQVDVTRRVSDAVNAIGGATSSNAPNKYQYINLVATLDALSNGDFALADFLSGRVTSQTLVEAAHCYHELLGKNFPRTTVVQMKLFDQYPTQVLSSLIENDKITTSLDATTKQKLVSGLQTAMAQNFVIGKDSIETLIADSKYATSIGSSDAAKAFVRKLARLAVLVRVPQDLKYLWDTPFDSASVIAHTPRTSFVSILIGKGMPQDSPVAIHDLAGTIEARNEQAWTALLASKSQWSPATMSSSGTASTAPTASTATVNDLSTQLINYTNLFGDVYVDPCDDCSSVTSPAAYYVDLLRMLKNCPSDLTNSTSASLLTKLIERRPDLTNLQLTCANTNITLPYLDLANEAMESFIANMPASGSAATVTLQTFDMTDTDKSSRNTQQPQKTQASVYRDKLSKSVFPLDVFPYNQAVDTIRAYASAVGASRYEIMAVAQSTHVLNRNASVASTSTSGSAGLVIRYALAAELLNLSPADHVAITASSIFPNSYFASQSGTIPSDSDYATKIGRGTADSYWGFTSSDAMLANVGGLSDVAGQFLVRASMSLQDLLNLLQTRFLGGRLVLGNTVDAPIFNTDIKDLRLRHPTSENPKRGLTTADCFALQAFIRLWRKCGWSLSDLDLALTYFNDQTGPVDNLPLISADSIGSLADVQELHRLTDMSIESLMPLWGLIDTFGNSSLYAKLFLQGDATRVDPVFGRDVKGRFLADTQRKISENRSTIVACLKIQDEHFNSVLYGAGVVSDVLNLANVSAIYRVSLFCQMLEISPLYYSGFAAMFMSGFSPFGAPQDTLNVLKQWRACSLGGLDLPQVLFITGIDQSLQLNNPGFGISDRSSLDIVATMLTGMLKLDREIPLGTAIDTSMATVAEVTRIANLVFDPETGPRVVDFIEGTGTASRVVTNPIYQDVLRQHFQDNEANAKSVLFEQTQPTGTAEEVAIALETQSKLRRVLFLRALSPVLKERLTEELIVNCITDAVPGNDRVVCQLLVSDIIQDTITDATALEMFTKLLQTNNGISILSDAAYFRPPSTDAYRFFFADSTGQNTPKVTLDGVTLTWTAALGGWSSNEVKLINGESYGLRATSQDLMNATFSNVRSVGLPLTSDVLVHAKTIRNAGAILLTLLRAAAFISAFTLDVPTVQFMHRQADSATLAVNFSRITYDDIRKAQRFNTLRTRTATTDLHAIDYFRWAGSPDANASLSEKLSALTGITRTQLDDYLNAKYPGVSPTVLMSLFRADSEIASLLDVVDFTNRFGIPGMSFRMLYNLSTPLEPTSMDQHYSHAAEIQRISQSLPVSDSGDGPITEANNILRVNQRRALATYLLQQDFMRTRGILDFGNLFEYFLIDVEMSPCLQTSRLKQAISAVQLFIQRCILGLEKPRGISSGTVNLDRWAWMQRYRLWEANRKVFLYPENWLEPSLRDNKSEVFKAFEDNLLQTDADEESIKQLIREYIYGVNVVADLDFRAYSWDRRSDGSGILHFFARTRHAPYSYFYRSAMVSGTPSLMKLDSFTEWKAWSRIDVDIPAIEADAYGQPLPLPGAYLVPAIRDQRIFLFLPHIVVKNKPITDGPATTTTFQSMANDSVRKNMPTQYWQIQMAWTELRNGKWSSKVLAPDVLTVAGAQIEDYGVPLPVTSGIWAGCSIAPTKAMWQEAVKLPSVESFKFTTYTRPGVGNLSVVTIVVDRWIGPFDNKYYRYPCGAFELRGEQLILLDRDAFVATLYASTFTETVPSSFNKVIWPSTKLSANPDYRFATVGSDAVKLYWAKVDTATDQVRPKSTFTMSFDMTRDASAAHGLIVEMQLRSSTQTMLNQVKTSSSTESGYEVSTSEEMSNTLWPAVLNATSANSNLDQTYGILAADIPQNSKYQQFGAENANRSETSMPAAIYNWELGLHVVMLLMERLRDLQQFDLGIRIARYVFDPTIDGSNLDRCWGFIPFREIAKKPIASVESLLRSLSASSGAESTMSPNILSSRKNPFNAHVIARGRPSAYMKRFVMTYIEILISSGDEYFRQNSLETLPLAINRYIQASHLFGSAPKPMPKIGRRAPRSYAQLDASFNDFANTSFDLELNFPFWCDPSKRGGIVSDTSASYSLTGMLRSTYFCVPTNPKLVQLKGLIEDRLFKIRNCQDINGVTRSLSLFEPPLDVGALTRAMAAGISVNAVLNDTVGPMPNLRFSALLQKALDICGELKNMGAAFQAVKETRDAEALAALQAKQDRTMQEMTMRTKTLAREEIIKSIDELQETRRSHVTRLQYWLALTGDKKDVPNDTTDWDDIAQSIEAPSTDGLALTSNNRAEIRQTNAARGRFIAAASLDGIAGVIKAIPNIGTEIEPFGVGCEISDVTGNIADSISIFAGVIRSAGEIYLLDAGLAARKSEFIGQLQERRQEANAAGRDIKIVDKQISTLRTTLAICEEDIRQQGKMIEHAAATHEFLRSKYTGEQLYVWMDGQIRNLFYQTYLLANDVAKKAQKLYRFERCDDKADYISQGYWNSSRDGMLSGENLYLALKRLEAAYDSRSGHDFEITKDISLRSLQPLALFNLRETGAATFTLPEVIFDYDFPGHYMRRIKTLSVSILTSSDVGVNMCATLRLLEHYFRTASSIPSGQDYAMKASNDDRFSTDQVPVSAIAVSQASDDSGCFDYELEFNDYQRFVPFEGAGVIGKWQIELPTAVKQFDYNLIKDVTLKMRYTSMYGGAAFRKAASDAARSFQSSVTNLSTNEGLFTLIDVPQDFPTQWTTLSTQTNVTKSVTLSGLQNKLPFYTQGKQVKVETITAFIVATDKSIAWASNLTLSGQASVTWKAGTDIGQFKVVTQTGLAERITDWTLGVTTAGKNAGLQKLFFVVRYYLK